MTTYTCFRCNYTTSYKNSMVSHLKKKKKCIRQFDELNKFSDEEISSFSLTKNCTLDKICSTLIDERDNQSNNELLDESSDKSTQESSLNHVDEESNEGFNNYDDICKINSQLLKPLLRSSLSASNSFSTTTTSITTQNTPNGVVNTKNFNIDINANCSLEDSLSLLDTQLTNCGITDNVQRKQVLDAIEKSLSSLNDKISHQSSKSIFNSPNLKNYTLNSSMNVGNTSSSIQTNNFTKNGYSGKGY